jgi:hypothetical protein
MPLPDRDQVQVQSYPFSLNNTSVSPTPNNPAREYLLIQNQGLAPVQLSFGKPNSTTAGVYIIAGASEKEWKEKVPTGSINLTSTGATSGVILEGI